MASNPPVATCKKATPLRQGHYHDALLTPLDESTHMPTYHIEMLEGRTLAQKKKLVEEITRVSVEVLGGKPESVDILITDVKRENWATGGVLWAELSA